MTVSYPARDKDRSGEGRTTISNDGMTLTMVVRGLRSRGDDFDSFEPQDVSDPMQLSSFSFLHGDLCSCLIGADIPLSVVTPNGEVNGLLTFERELGGPLPTGQMDRERPTLRLTVNEMTYSSQDKSGWFEDELLDLQGRLPSGTFMKACITSPSRTTAPTVAGFSAT